MASQNQEMKTVEVEKEMHQEASYTNITMNIEALNNRNIESRATEETRVSKNLSYLQNRKYQSPRSKQEICANLQALGARGSPEQDNLQKVQKYLDLYAKL